MLAALIAPACVAAPALAAGTESELQELKAMIATLQQKVATIEQAPAKAAEPASGNLLPKGLKIYGNLDSGVERISNVGPTAKTLTRVPSTTGTTPSAIGLDFRGNLNDGVAAVAKAEMGVALDSSSSGQGGRLFGRQMFVGVDSALGTVTVGRQYSMLFYGLQGADVLGPNIYGLSSIDAYIPNARADNSVAWRKAVGQVSLGAHYSFGRDTVSNTVPASGVCAGEDATDTSRCRGWSAMARYDSQAFGASVAIDKQRGGTGAQANFFNGSAPLTMTAASDEDKRVTANGYARFGAFKLGAGWLSRRLAAAAGNVKQETTWLQGEYAISPKWVVDGGVFRVSNDTQGKSANLYVIRAIRKIDDQLSAYLTAGYMDNGSTAAYSVSAGGPGAAASAGKAQLGTMAGVRYRF
ncbi:porin [Massilia solisilvae]|uniref:Porin n=1 Tax=Massilia solisilvae TaxID=1811225 RepID=A0ABT2BKW7_9BURK|nr:porin [Massilia solisilvae]MCS0609127.1 porin [Massilia solisilvae]